MYYTNKQTTIFNNQKTTQTMTTAQQLAIKCLELKAQRAAEYAANGATRKYKILQTKAHECQMAIMQLAKNDEELKDTILANFNGDNWIVVIAELN